MSTGASKRSRAQAFSEALGNVDPRYVEEALSLHGVAGNAREESEGDDMGTQSAVFAKTSWYPKETADAGRLSKGEGKQASAGPAATPIKVRAARHTWLKWAVPLAACLALIALAVPVYNALQPVQTIGERVVVPEPPPALSVIGVS